MTRARGLAALLLAGLTGGTAGAAPFDPFQAAAIDPRPGAILPFDLPVQDETGTVTSLRRLAQGRPVLLAPVQHDCPNICGVTLAGLGQAIQARAARPGRDFTLIAFGIDPAERPATAAASLERLRAAAPGLSGPGVHAVTAAAATVQAVTAALGYRYAWDPALGQYAHIAATAVLTADGRLDRWLYGVAPDPAALADGLAAAAAGAGPADQDGWIKPLLLLCYRYDPQAGRNGPLIWALLRLGGGLTVALGAGLIGRSWLRDRRRWQGHRP